MRIFVACFLVIRAFYLADAVSYGTPQIEETSARYTLFAIAGALLLPVLLGFVYSRFSLWRFRRSGASVDVKASTNLGDNATSAASNRASLAAYLLRLTEMRSNPVMRLWWKRQEKLYSIVDDDIEAQGLRTEDEAEPRSPRLAKTEAAKPRKVKVIDKVDELPTESNEKKSKKEKKEKKEKKDKDLGPADPVIEAPDTASAGTEGLTKSSIELRNAYNNEVFSPNKSHKEKKRKEIESVDLVGEALDESIMKAEKKEKKEKKGRESAEKQDMEGGENRSDKKEKKKKHKLDE